MQSLSPSLPLLDYTQDLHALVLRVSDRHSTELVLEGALEALSGILPYDLAVIFRLYGETLRVAAAAGPLVSPRIRSHELALAQFPTLRRALETRRPMALREHHHGDEGDPYSGVLDLPNGHSCMVVPLFAGGRSLGLVTFDRTSCGVYPDPMVQLAGVYGQLISLALLFAEQAAQLDRYRHQLKEQNRLLQEEAGGAELACQQLEASHSLAMRQVVQLARQVAPVDLPVLILGETGTGKEVLSQAIHHWSARADGPFVKLNCSSIPENLVESELFGHVKGAFSGADRERRGRFLTANGGTLLLDEIGDMPLGAQAKLLRVLQEGTFEPVGADRTVKVDVRILAATHVDLAEAMRSGRFREDLYYRLAVFPLNIPPLRARREDILEIAERFLRAQTRRGGRGPWTLSPEACALLEASSWPGNIREMLNCLERATILQPGGLLEPHHLNGIVGAKLPEVPWLETQPAVTETEPILSFEAHERRYFERLLERVGGRIYGEGGAAELADLKPTTLRSKLVKLGLR